MYHDKVISSFIKPKFSPIVQPYLIFIADAPDIVCYMRTNLDVAMFWIWFCCEICSDAINAVMSQSLFCCNFSSLCIVGWQVLLRFTHFLCGEKWNQKNLSAEKCDKYCIWAQQCYIAFDGVIQNDVVLNLYRPGVKV